MQGSQPPALARHLKNRHIQLIALGGAIGTGLFYGAAESIRLVGPGIVLAYPQAYPSVTMTLPRSNR